MKKISAILSGAFAWQKIVSILMVLVYGWRGMHEPMVCIMLNSCA